MNNEIVISVGRVIVQCGAIASALTFVTTLFYVTACAKVQWPWKIVIALRIAIFGCLYWFGGEPPRTKDKRMNYEVIALGIVVADIMSAVVVLAPLNADWRKLIVLATATGGLFFFAFVRLAAAADQVKGYCYADAHGYVIVTDGDFKDAKSFGEKAADDAAQYHNKTGNPLLATKLKALCEAEGAKRYPESRRVADWFAVQAAKAFMDEYARRTKK